VEFVGGSGAMDAMLGDIKLVNCAIDKVVERNIERTIELGKEGDDLIDTGARSAEFTVKGKFSLGEFKTLEAEIRKGQPMFKSDYGTYKVAVKRLEYKSGTGEYTLLLVEDVV
jgi:hypothetical protein